jgi:rfaE bifunctional protein nucleotidyltransferase chain/domain
VNLNQVTDQISKWQKKNQKVVLVTGVFDLLHIEHIRFLTQAKAAGDKLIVGVESDTRAKSIKGHDRPINNQAIRLEQIAAIKVVDLAFVLPEKFSTQTDWESFMASITPNIYAVSSNTAHLENKRTICQKYGATLKIVHPFNPEYSSSKLAHKLLQSS